VGRGWWKIKSRSKSRFAIWIVFGGEEKIEIHSKK